MSGNDQSTGASNASAESLWADAMNEQMSSENSAAGQTAAKDDVVVNFSEDLNMVLDIPVKMTVELGRTKMTIKELLRLSQGSIVSLEGLAGEPLDILINGYLIAQGEVVVVSDKFGIRITDIITPSERMYRLNR